jgi:tetratricopeptide (TPR) repeat protein
MGLAERFQELREQAGLTKTALARPRYTVSYVSQIEAGRRRPSSDALAYFSDRMGVTPEFLASGVPDGIDRILGYELEESGRELRSGRSAEAERTARRVVAQAERYGLARLGARAVIATGHALMYQGRVHEAIGVFEDVALGDLPEHEAGMAMAAIGRAYRTVGDLGYAAQVIESFLADRGGGPLAPGVVAELHTVLVSIYFERGDVVRAERSARRALAAADQGAAPEIRANTYWDASRVLAEARKWDEALDLAARARFLMEEMDDRRRVARLHNAHAFLCLEAEPPRLGEAEHHLDVAEALLKEGSVPGDLAYVYAERSRLELLRERPEQALRYAERALTHVGIDELEEARCLFQGGRALGLLDRLDEASEALTKSATLFQKHGARQQEAGCWRELGELHLGAGDIQAAVNSFRSGLAALDPGRSRA